MKAVGIIVEYNPFHNGHLYHVQQSKLQNEAPIAIAVMSGSFLQRGEPAIVNKWSRTKMALQGGVDIVIELPYLYSSQHAKYFATGAVSLLEAVKCDTFCFGSENGTIDQFIHMYHQMEHNREPLNEEIRLFNKQGNSYPKSVSLALEKLGLQTDNGIDIAKPNNILGYQYISATLENDYKIKPTLINRVAADYHDTTLPSGNIASATSIRKALLDNNLSIDTASSFMPSYTFKELQAYIDRFHILHSWEHYWPLLQYKLLSLTTDDLENIYEVEEGIQHRMKEAAKQSDSFTQFIMHVKTKRYTLTRLQRICVHILTNTKKDTMVQLINEPTYLRVLGFTENGRKYLSMNKKKFELPLITKAAGASHDALSLDIKAAMIHSLALPAAFRTEAFKREYQQLIIKQ